MDRTRPRTVAENPRKREAPSDTRAQTGRWKGNVADTDLSNLVGLDDGALIQRAGEREAFSEPVRRHEDAVYRVCKRVLGDREGAQDAALGALIRAYRKLEIFRERGSCRTWMLGLAVNVGLNERARRKEPTPQDVDREPVPSPEDRVIEADGIARLYPVLRSTPGRPDLLRSICSRSVSRLLLCSS